MFCLSYCPVVNTRRLYFGLCFLRRHITKDIDISSIIAGKATLEFLTS
jgi:hypothetical protein